MYFLFYYFTSIKKCYVLLFGFEYSFLDICVEGLINEINDLKTLLNQFLNKPKLSVRYMSICSNMLYFLGNFVLVYNLVYVWITSHSCWEMYASNCLLIQCTWIQFSWGNSFMLIYTTVLGPRILLEYQNFFVLKFHSYLFMRLQLELLRY